MRAAVLHGPGDLRVQDHPEPDPASHEVKVRVSACGICGSDLHLLRGAGLGRATSAGRPFVLGHEFAGEVVDVGPEVTDVRAGDRVAVRPTVSCGTCPACAAGAVNVCRTIRFYGVHPDLDGGMGDFAVVPERNVHRIPDSLDLVLAALTEPVAVALHAVRRGAAGADDAVVVFGAGPIGIAILLCLQADGIRDVFVVEPSPARRAVVPALGAAAVLDPDQPDLRARLLEATSGRGAQVTFESAGHPAAFTAAQRVTMRQGRIVVVAAYEQPVFFDPFFLLSTEQTLTAALAYTPQDFGGALALLAAGDIPVDGWVDTVPLGDVLDTGFGALQRQEATKLLVRP